MLSRVSRRLGDDRGSAPAEFAMVAALLTALLLAVLQLALALHVRNTTLDAAAEGARYGALADRGPADAAQRTRELITTAVGADFAGDVTVDRTTWQGSPVIRVTVRSQLPVLGLWGPEAAMEVSGHAVVETLD